jgi:hypothetical protein
MIRIKLIIFFLDHVLNEKLAEKLLHQYASRIDEVSWPIFHSKCDQEKKIISLIS